MWSKTGGRPGLTSSDRRTDRPVDRLTGRQIGKETG